MRLKAVLVCLASGAAAAVVACGDDGGAGKLPDAPLSDGATPDTPDPATPARLTIRRDGVGVEDIDVYFQNADNTLVAKKTTDVNGVVEATVMPGAYVTVVNPFAAGVVGGLAYDDLQTFSGVQPGDQLVLQQGSGPGNLTNFDLLVDSDPDGSQYKAWSTCLPFGGGNAPWYLSAGSGGGDRVQGSPQLVDCGTTTDVLIESENGSASGVGWIFKDDAPVAAANASLDLTGPYTATPTVTLQYTSIPTSVFSIDSRTILATSDGPLWQDFVNIGSGGASMRSFERPAPAGATQVFFTRLTQNGFAPQTVIDWQPIATAPTFSLENTLLRRITNDGSFDPATATVTWTEEATGEAPDLAIAQLSTFRKGASPLAWTWKVAGAITGASLKYPTLPTEIARYNPVAGDPAGVLELTTAKVPGGYSAVRPFVLSGNLAGFFAGPSGRAVVQFVGD